MSWSPNQFSVTADNGRTASVSSLTDDMLVSETSTSSSTHCPGVLMLTAWTIAEDYLDEYQAICKLTLACPVQKTHKKHKLQNDPTRKCFATQFTHQFRYWVSCSQCPVLADLNVTRVLRESLAKNLFHLSTNSTVPLLALLLSTRVQLFSADMLTERMVVIEEKTLCLSDPFWGESCLWAEEPAELLQQAFERES